MMVYVRKSCLACPATELWKFHLYRYPLCRLPIPLPPTFPQPKSVWSNNTWPDAIEQKSATNLSVLGISLDFVPCPGVKMYRLTTTLCQPLCLSYFGCLCVPSGIKYWHSFNHCFARVWWTWRRSSILEFLCFVSRNKFLYFGLDSSCRIEQSNELTLIGVIRCKWWNNALM
jgi:hypothetical protein